MPPQRKQWCQPQWERARLAMSNEYNKLCPCPCYYFPNYRYKANLKTHYSTLNKILKEPQGSTESTPFTLLSRRRFFGLDLLMAVSPFLRLVCQSKWIDNSAKRCHACLSFRRTNRTGKYANGILWRVSFSVSIGHYWQAL